MTNLDYGTLAYSKSPKASRRTTFQDELHAAVSARASKTQLDRYSYSDDFNEEEDDFLNELIRSRKKRNGTSKAGKSKEKINNFDISDDEDKPSRTKRVSFLKTQRISSFSGDTTESESHESKPPDSSIGQHNSYNNSFSSRHSTSVSEDNVRLKSSEAESTDHEVTKGSSSKSLPYQTSGDSLLDMSLPLPSDNSMVDTPAPEEKSPSPQSAQLSATDQKHMSSAESATEREVPRPKPRQRTLGLSLRPAEKIPEDAESQDLSRPQTSSASFALSTCTSSNIAWTEGDPELSQSLTKSPLDSQDGFISGDGGGQERKYSTSFDEFNQDSEDHSYQVSQSDEKSFGTRPSSSPSQTTQRSQSACSRKVSKYLGSLKVLDRKISLQESQPQAPDSLRAAVYQDWLKKKKEKVRENIELKKKDELLREKKKKDEEAKKEDAVVSYEAWKEKKAESLKAKAKEKQEIIRKEQKAMEERREKVQSAKAVFEKWKSEQDRLLKEKHRKQKEAESEKEFKKQEQEEQRKRDSKSAFSNWSEKKKDILHEKVLKEREKTQNKADEERYMKEERDKEALEMYENWLVRKNLEQKRQREERRIQAILSDSPPPPWSPPNKTIPFGK